jgi:hypothetical protein
MGKGEAQIIFPRLAQYLFKRCVGEVLKLINIEIERVALRGRHARATHGGHLEHGYKDRA